MDFSTWAGYNGYMYLVAENQSYKASTVAVANFAGGVPFTISDSHILNSDNAGAPIDSFLQANAYYGSIGAPATAEDNRFLCWYPNYAPGNANAPCNVSAVSLPTGQVATAISDSSLYLYVDIWTYSGPV